VWRSAVCSLVSVIALSLVAAVRHASAQIPSNGTFFACVRLDKGGDNAKLARLVSSDENCKPNEQRVSWNVAGPQGPQGFSVSLETVATGQTDCSGRGGVKLTLIDQQGIAVSAQPQFVCNGATGPPGPAGTTGQSSTTYFATPADKDVANSTTPCSTPFSGFPVIVKVPENTDVLITADGAIQNAAAGATGTIVDVFLQIDGSRSPDGVVFYGFKRIFGVNAVFTGHIVNWSLTRRWALSAGDHTVGLCASLGASGVQNANVSGSPTSGLQTALTVTFIKR
jgi:hypothetical protein